MSDVWSVVVSRVQQGQVYVRADTPNEARDAALDEPRATDWETVHTSVDAIDIVDELTAERIDYQVVDA